MVLRAQKYNMLKFVPYIRVYLLIQQRLQFWTDSHQIRNRNLTRQFNWITRVYFTVQSINLFVQFSHLSLVCFPFTMGFRAPPRCIGFVLKVIRVSFPPEETSGFRTIITLLRCLSSYPRLSKFDYKCLRRR